MLDPSDPTASTLETGGAPVSIRNSESSSCCCSAYRRALPGDGHPDKVPPGGDASHLRPSNVRVALQVHIQ